MTIRAAVSSSLALLTPRDRRRYRVAVLGQMTLSILDLIGVLLIAAVGYVAATLATGSEPPEPVSALATEVGLGAVSAGTTAMLLGAAAAAILVTKSVASLLIQRTVFHFLARRTGEVADRMANAFLSQPLLRVQLRPTHWNAYAFVEGLTSSVPLILGSLLIASGEVALLVVLSAGLMVLDPVTTIAALAYFGTLLFVIHRRLSRSAARLSRVTAAASIEARSAVQDAVSTYREVSVTGRRNFFRDRIVDARTKLAQAQAEMSFIVAIPRYGIEAALVIGCSLVVFILLLTRDEASAFGSLFLFLAAASRVTPALLRLNAAVITIKSSAAGAERTFTLVDELELSPGNPTQGAPPGAQEVVAASRPDRFDISARALDLQYPGRSTKALTGVSVDVAQGTSLALVGPTGAGKSSLVDVLLGVAAPSAGTVRIGDLSPREFTVAFPGALAYVPQDVAIVHGTIRTNVALGIADAEVNDERVWDALDRSHLSEFIRSQSSGLDAQVGDRGVRLSGGQRQRLGLARAFYQLPCVLVLDEATSALDSETEHAVSDTITSLGADTTVITVAHRLATIRHADQVAYLDDGRLVACGTFEEVRAAVPSFEIQAQLMGL
jgi:ABC-type multidrug transport system fused ATPase/permease subunit